jgi:hypothetical protein
MKRIFMMGLVFAGTLAACTYGREAGYSARVHYAQIRDTVTPMMVYAKVGDEIRWQNLRKESVKIGLLGNPKLDTVACQKGFSWMGATQDLVTVKPSEYVSLCFSEPATIRFSVWMDVEDLTRDMSPTGTIRVSKEPG